MEENNDYVSSRGILKSCNYYSATPRSGIRQLINYPELNKIKNIKNPSIYICSNAIPHFIKVLLPLINFSFILVSGDSDETVPHEVLNIDNFNLLLNDNRVIHWFCQNIIIKHPKITIMPIGLDYHTLTQTPIWGPISSCEEQERMLKMIKNKSTSFKLQISCTASYTHHFCASLFAGLITNFGKFVFRFW